MQYFSSGVPVHFWPWLLCYMVWFWFFWSNRQCLQSETKPNTSA